MKRNRVDVTSLPKVVTHVLSHLRLYWEDSNIATLDVFIGVHYMVCIDKRKISYFIIIVVNLSFGIKDRVRCWL